jgi:hypothetical protein
VKKREERLKKWKKKHKKGFSMQMGQILKQTIVIEIDSLLIFSSGLVMHNS